MYDMKNFIVNDGRSYMRTTNAPYAITFSHMTVVEAVEEPFFPLDMFNFKPFNELLQAECVDETEMFDIIGEVVGKENLKKVITSKVIALI
ncbi:hypothetical protein PIB30_039909 [Stylosanthes scabra]|uniref:Uncharacterized protein n=1 Tax=Stylosanthes scabra TaxID=79078 RepID=A0ABU6QDU1_9FABA|nr:hypothetical protein [Stylosanthes scabra]